MVTLLMLSIFCLVAGVVLTVVLSLIGLPLMLLLGLLPWILRIAGVVLLLKALFMQPTKGENFIPAVTAFEIGRASCRERVSSPV